MSKPLDKLKHGDKIVNALDNPLFFAELVKATSLDTKTLQAALARLKKNGYISQASSGVWKKEETCKTTTKQQ